MPVHPEPVEGTELVEVPGESRQGFDRLSPNGVGFVFCSFVFPIVLSLSKGKLSPNGMGFVFRLFEFPIVLSPSKDRLSLNGLLVERNPRPETQPVRTEPVEVPSPKFAASSFGRLSPNRVWGVAQLGGTQFPSNTGLALALNASYARLKSSVSMQMVCACASDSIASSTPMAHS